MSLRKRSKAGPTLRSEDLDSPSRRTPVLRPCDIWNAALEEYRRSVNADLRYCSDNFLQQMEECSIEDHADILDMLEGTSNYITDKRRGGKISRALRKTLKPLVRGLCVILSASGETASSLVRLFGQISVSQSKYLYIGCSGRKGHFCRHRCAHAGRRNLLLPVPSDLNWCIQAAERVSTSYDHLVKLFGGLHAYVERLQVRLEVPVRQEAANIAVKGLIEMLKALELATRMVQRGRIRECPLDG